MLVSKQNHHQKSERSNNEKTRRRFVSSNDSKHKQTDKQESIDFVLRGWWWSVSHWYQYQVYVGRPTERDGLGSPTPPCRLIAIANDPISPPQPQQQEQLVRLPRPTTKHFKKQKELTVGGPCGSPSAIVFDFPTKQKKEEFVWDI